MIRHLGLGYSIALALLERAAKVRTRSQLEALNAMDKAPLWQNQASGLSDRCHQLSLLQLVSPK